MIGVLEFFCVLIALAVLANLCAASFLLWMLIQDQLYQRKQKAGQRELRRANPSIDNSRQS